jgi:hypothetical protein
MNSAGEAKMATGYVEPNGMILDTRANATTIMGW